MIKTVKLTKSYDGVKALESIDLTIKDNSVFGLIGTNGAGKSTYMRILSGIIKQDDGLVFVDEQSVYDNPEVKANICFLSDEQYYPLNANAIDMEKIYSLNYSKFDKTRFYEMIDKFGLDKKRKIRTYSKGMKKQLQIILGICCNTKYLICDETFDGLDPVVRQAIKSVIAGEIAEREFTAIIASHNLRELEDICDSVGLLYKGGVVLNKDLEEMKTDIHRIQCVFKEDKDVDAVADRLSIVKDETRGSLHLITVRGNAEEVKNTIEDLEPVFYELLPLTLEEIFISETEVIGYDIKKLIL